MALSNCYIISYVLTTNRLMNELMNRWVEQYNKFKLKFVYVYKEPYIKT